MPVKSEPIAALAQPLAITQNFHFRPGETYSVPLKPTLKVVVAIQNNRPAAAMEALLGDTQWAAFCDLHNDEDYESLSVDFFNGLTKLYGGNS